MKIEPKARAALRGSVRRVESHAATPGSLDKRGRDWNSDTLRLFMTSGEVVYIEGGCYGMQVTLRGQ